MSLAAARWIIRLLAWVLPVTHRTTWREEWLAEVDHVHAARGAHAALALAAGAFADVLTIRRLGASAWCSWTDLKLGLRMFARYPGLAFVSVLGLTVAIAIGAVSFTILYGYMQPDVPLPEGDRLVALQMWDRDQNAGEPHALSDLGYWQGQLRTIPELGAYRVIRRNLIVAGGTAEPVTIAEMTASGFAIARTAPVLGRPILEGDQRPSADPVVVIGFDVWQSQFAADSSVIGRTVRLGGIPHTIVGVMPRGFGFPVNSSLWTPLQIDPRDVAPRQGPAVSLFGRLAAGATMDSARAELETVGNRATVSPATHAHLIARVLPYIALYDAISGSESARWQVHLVQSLFTTILILVGANVAILIYARTATRIAEIAVRTALGATRMRIVGQLFVEALVLSAAACLLGLLVASAAIRVLDVVLMTAGGGLPFWIHTGISTGAMIYAAALALAAAAIAGVIPALQATGRHVQADLRQLGGSTGLRLGATWTALIVMQVAIAVALLPWVLFQAQALVPYAVADPGAGAGNVVVARLAMDDDAAAGAEPEASAASRYAARQRELADRLRREPDVLDVAYSMTTPGDERTAFVEIEGLPTPGDEAIDIAVRVGRPGHEVRLNRVSENYLSTFGVPVLAGRALTAADAASHSAVVVSRSFARLFFGGANPVGRHVRYVGLSGDVSDDDVELNRWYEIVGLTADFPAHANDPNETLARIYQPLAIGQGRAAILSVHVESADRTAFASRLRGIAAGVDPAIRLENVEALDAVLREEQGMTRVGAVAVVLVAISVLLLSAAGVFALMSFTVAKRRKEIGIRIALGADRARIVRAVFVRAARQIACGIAAGCLMAVAGDRSTAGQLLHGNPIVLLVTVAVLMTAVSTAAAIVPTRRALRVEPTDALRSEA